MMWNGAHIVSHRLAVNISIKEFYVIFNKLCKHDSLKKLIETDFKKIEK